ncbi:MAG: hypothetical protein WCA96_09975, partial [Methylocella sp.]
MLQRWPVPLRSIASRMNCDVSPWATPVSTSLSGPQVTCQTSYGTHQPSIAVVPWTKTLRSYP